MEERASERDLVVAYKLAKEEAKRLDDELKEAKKVRDKTESALIELLVANNAEATAKYDGLGYVRLNKPKLYASCNKDNQDKLFLYLHEVSREDLIKEAVPPQTLSVYVSELVEEGKPIPEFISHYFKQTVHLQK